MELYLAGILETKKIVGLWRFNLHHRKKYIFFFFLLLILFFREVLSFLSSLGGLDEIHTGDQSEQVSVHPYQSDPSRSLSRDEFLCTIRKMSSPLTSVPAWFDQPLELCVYLCICRSSSEAVILFLHGQTFPGIFAASCLHTWRNCESLSWVMCVYPPQAPEVTPSRHRQGGQHLRVAISKVARLGEGPRCLCCLSAIWLCLEERWVGGVWGGNLLAGPCNVFRSTDFWQHGSIRWRKMPAANESQQCLANWTTTRKALCNWDTVNISKLSLNKLSVFIFSTLYLDIFATICNWRNYSECTLSFFWNQGHFACNYFSIWLSNGPLAKWFQKGKYRA